MKTIFYNWLTNWMIGMICLGIALVNNLEDQNQIIEIWTTYALTQPIFWVACQYLEDK